MQEALAFLVSPETLDAAEIRRVMADQDCGAYAQFEGWVRNVNDGRKVLRLEYEVFEPLAEREGLRIIEEAVRQFGLTRAVCVHRTGILELGDCAVIVAVAAPHRDEAFRGCRYIIDEVKTRLPIWKREHYADGAREWVNCQDCAASAGTD